VLNKNGYEVSVKKNVYVFVSCLNCMCMDFVLNQRKCMYAVLI